MGAAPHSGVRDHGEISFYNEKNGKVRISSYADLKKHRHDAASPILPNCCTACTDESLRPVEVIAASACNEEQENSVGGDEEDDGSETGSETASRSLASARGYNFHDAMRRVSIGSEAYNGAYGGSPGSPYQAYSPSQGNCMPWGGQSEPYSGAWADPRPNMQQQPYSGSFPAAPGSWQGQGVPPPMMRPAHPQGQWAQPPGSGPLGSGPLGSGPLAAQNPRAPCQGSAQLPSSAPSRAQLLAQQQAAQQQAAQQQAAQQQAAQAQQQAAQQQAQQLAAQQAVQQQAVQQAQQQAQQLALEQQQAQLYAQQQAQFEAQLRMQQGNAAAYSDDWADPEGPRVREQRPLSPKRVSSAQVPSVAPHHLRREEQGAPAPASTLTLPMVMVTD